MQTENMSILFAKMMKNPLNQEFQKCQEHLISMQLIDTLSRNQLW